MTENHSAPRSRSRRRADVQRLYAARDIAQQPMTEENQPAPPERHAPFQRPLASAQPFTPNEQPYPYTPNEETIGEWEGYEPNEETRLSAGNETAADWGGYTPNEEGGGASFGEEAAADWSGYTPNGEPVPSADAGEKIDGAEPGWGQEEAWQNQQTEEPDFSAYYRRDIQADEPSSLDGPAFAPASSMNLYAYASALHAEDNKSAAPGNGSEGNVYRPREATWSQEERRETLQTDGLAYQVQSEAPAKRRRKKRLVRNLLVGFGVLAFAGALCLLRQPLQTLLGLEPAATETPQAAEAPQTAETIRAYTLPAEAELAPVARNAISQLCGTVAMDPCIVTESNVVTVSPRQDGLYDYYLFTAEGRLLCYFEGLAKGDMMVQPEGAFYVRQAPWLVTGDGSALIRTADLEKQLGAKLTLHPLQHGWAIAENPQNGSHNFINTSAQLLSPLWFARVFPFTGAYTLGYVDTGSDPDQRYLLYVLGEDGSFTRWTASADMADVVGSACGMAYLQSGQLYRLPNTDAPLLQTPSVEAYPDCGAVVVQDAQTGKYGLLVDGRPLYECVYDAIHPMESELAWEQTTLGGVDARFTIHAVASEQYPLPLAYSFALEKDGTVEYVALSADSSCPIPLSGEY